MSSRQPDRRPSRALVFRVPNNRSESPLPLPLGLLAGVGAAFFIFPLLGLLVRMPWASAWLKLTSPTALQALRLSLLASLSATALAIALGVPLAWVYARVSFPG